MQHLRIIFMIAFGVTCLESSPLTANEWQTKRHVVILQGGTDMVWANYLFSVQNPSEEAVELSVPLMLPKEKTDFRAQEGIKQEDIVLGDEDQNLLIKKVFPAGMTLIGLGFSAPATFGSADLSFTAPFDIEELIIMSRQNTLNLQAAGMTYTKNQNFAGRPFDMLKKLNIKKGETISVVAAGISEGRGRYWFIGGVVALLLALAGGFLTWRTMPTLDKTGEYLIEATDG